MKVKIIVLVGILLQILGTNSFIVPDEVPSILSVIYSNIPTIKKGTDSRLGWGFRLGNRADFQVLVELGPQTNTQPLANQPSNTNNKRNTLNSLANVLYAQRQQDKKANQLQQQKQNSESEGGKWLASWSSTMKENNQQENETQDKVLVPRPGIGIGEIDAKSVIPEEGGLEELHGGKGGKPKVTTEKTKTSGKLDDVDLEDEAT